MIQHAFKVVVLDACCLHRVMAHVNEHFHIGLQVEVSLNDTLVIIVASKRHHLLISSFLSLRSLYVTQVNQIIVLMIITLNKIN